MWLARDTLLDRDVAIKLGMGAVTDASRVRFRVEARAVARLRHPNIRRVSARGIIQDHRRALAERSRLA